MAKFLVQFTTYLVLESEQHHTFEDLDNSFDIGSRCWEDEIVQQLSQECDEAEQKGVCNLGYRSGQKVISVLPDDHPALPDGCHICLPEKMWDEPCAGRTAAKKEDELND